MNHKCKDCKWFGRNLDKGNIEYCWSGLMKTSANRSACLVFEEKSKIKRSGE